MYVTLEENIVHEKHFNFTIISLDKCYDLTIINIQIAPRSTCPLGTGRGYLFKEHLDV